jgi:L-fuconolactonase
VIVDAHHHLWKIARGDYFWMDPRANPAVAPIARDFLVEDYRALAAANGVSGSVLVQAAQTIAETEWLLEQAQASGGLILGVVGWIDMAAADAPQVLDRLAGNPLLRGIRPMLQDLPDVQWVLQPALDPAFRALIAQDLAFDVLIKPPHLASALTLLHRYPELRAVVDHGAKPAIAQGAWQPWADQMRRIARETAACCKLSGLLTEASPQWSVDDLRRYSDHLIDCFGPGRLMWGSDWPVALLASDYADWLHAARQLLAGLSPGERAGIMGENARAFYRLAASRVQAHRER